MPRGDYDSWLILAGRGFGKTRTGVEWVLDKVQRAPALRIALVGATLDDAREVMAEGESGLLRLGDHLIAKWRPGLGEIHFHNGSMAKLFSAANPNSLRGPQHHFAWCDELAKWSRGKAAWDNLQLGLRLGDHPQAVVTTTPLQSDALEFLLKQEETLVTRGSTYDNPHLGARYLKRMGGLYEGTRFGVAELHGRLPPLKGALWTPELIAASRANGAGVTFERVVIGVDPPAGDGVCGIVACAADTQGKLHVLADHSIGESSPAVWAAKVVDAAEMHGRSLSDGRMAEVVAERNQGGEMVRRVLLETGPDLKVKLVNAAVGKAARAEPVALLFEAGRVRLHGCHDQLERQLCGLIAGGGYEGPGTSPDRADAMVWALKELSRPLFAGMPSLRQV